MGKVFILLTLISLNTWGQEAIPGLIPRFYSIEAANDLAVGPEEAHNMARNGEMDISESR